MDEGAQPAATIVVLLIVGGDNVGIGGGVTQVVETSHLVSWRFDRCKRTDLDANRIPKMVESEKPRATGVVYYASIEPSKHS